MRRESLVMPGLEQFWGNEPVVGALTQMAESGRIPQAILLGGVEGIGKATLARRFAARLLGGAERIEQDDLSLPANTALVEDREKWTAEKRAEAPLYFSTHPDFATFAPDGPLRQISIQQMRLLKDLGQFQPMQGSRRVFLIDHMDRANETAANSLLKLFEEPPPYLTLIATAENVYDLLPTIRSRAIIFQMTRLSDDQMRDFARTRQLDHAEGRIMLAEGSPGQALTLNLEEYRQRRSVMLTLLECGAGVTGFGEWVRHSESFGNRKSEKLETYAKIAYGLLEDMLLCANGEAPRKNRDVQGMIETVARRVSFAWMEKAASILDELVQMAARSIQKVGALDAMAISLRNEWEATCA